MMRPKILILATLYLAVFLNSFGYFITIPVLVQLITNPHHTLISAAMTHQFGDYIFSIVLGAGSLGSVIFAPILGRFSDQIGRKKVLILCASLMLISFILPVVSIITNSIYLFILGNTINGISSNNQPIAQAAITDLSQNRHNKAIRFSIDTVVICLAMVIGPMFGNILSDSSLVSWFSIKTPFIAAAGFSILSLILLVYALPETNALSQKHTQLSYHNSFGTFVDIVKIKPSLARCLIVFLLAQTSWAEFFQYFYLYLQTQFHFTTGALTAYSSTIGIVLIVGLLAIYPWLIRKTSFRRSVTASLTLSTIGALILGFIHQAWSQWLGMIPLALGIGMYFPSLLTIFSELTSKEQQGWIMSISMGLIGIGWLITGFTAIYFSHISAHLPMQVIFVCLLAACILMIIENYWHTSASISAPNKPESA